MPAQRIDSVSLNGGSIPFGGASVSDDADFQLDRFNNFELGISYEVPGYISVASDNGQMFECEVDYYDNLFGYEGLYGSEVMESHKFVTDNVPIPVSSNEYVFYSYGIDSKENVDSNSVTDENISNASFSIIVRNYRTNYVDEGDGRY